MNHVYREFANANDSSPMNSRASVRRGVNERNRESGSARHSDECGKPRRDRGILRVCACAGIRVPSRREQKRTPAKPNRPRRSTVSGRFEFESKCATRRTEATKRRTRRDAGGRAAFQTQIRIRERAPTSHGTLHRIPEQSEARRDATRRLNHLLSVLACLLGAVLSLSVHVSLSRFRRRGAANGNRAGGFPWETMCEIPPTDSIPTPARYRMRELSRLPVSCSSRTTNAVQVERPRRAAIVTCDRCLTSLSTGETVLSFLTTPFFRSASLSPSLAVH